MHRAPAELGGALLVSEAAAHRVTPRVRLLADFFEHVVRVIAFLNVLGGELDLANRVLADRAVDRADLKVFPVERNKIEIVQVNNIPGVSDDRTHVAGQKIFLLTDAENERTATPRSDNKIGNVCMDDRDAVGANDLLQRGARGIDQSRLGIFAIKL